MMNAECKIIVISQKTNLRKHQSDEFFCYASAHEKDKDSLLAVS